jgi:hypothetical protein
VVGVAYDDAGRVVGARRWETENGEILFEFNISSLAGRIERVEFVVEARP